MSDSQRTLHDREYAGLRLVQRLGVGAAGEVWLAQDAAERKVALKRIMLREGCDSSIESREQAALELLANQYSKLNGFVTIFHVGHTDTEHWYTMELADLVGDPPVPMSLNHEIQRRSRFASTDALDLIEQLLISVGSLHDAGMVHRDIKPTNIMAFDGVWKLGDIGLLTEERHEMTAVGTPEFIPPWGPIDRRADLYAIGRVLYCMVTGLPARSFPTLPTDLLKNEYQHQTKAVNRLIMKACDPDPEARFQSANDFLAELRTARLEINRIRFFPSRRHAVATIGCAAASLVAAPWVIGRFRKASTDTDEWTFLFDQTTLEGWFVDSPEHGPWLVEQGAITAPQSPNFQSLMTQRSFGPGRYQATVTPLNDRARLGITYGQPNGSHFLFYEDKYVWIRHVRKSGESEETERWRSFPGLIWPSANDSIAMEVNWGHDESQLIVNGKLLQTVPTTTQEGMLGLHVWGGDGGKFSSIKYRPHS